MRPVIGITSYVEHAQWGDWHTRAIVLPNSYPSAVSDAGGRAVVLPPSAAGAAETVARLDALVLAGGADIDPQLYGQLPHPSTLGTRPDRDEGELALLAAARAARIPVLGICRGMQLMAVAHGGALHQHMPEIVGHELHKGPAAGLFADHKVTLVEGSLVASILGTRASVRSYHHQGVATAGDLTVTGHAFDASIEVLEDPMLPFYLGVLWHPEQGDDPRMFEALVAAAHRHADHSDVHANAGSGKPAPADVQVLG